MTQRVKLADLMKKPVVTVDADTTAYEAAKLLRKHNIGNVVVVDQKKPVGIVTERDLVERVIASNRDPHKTKISRIMSRPLITAKPDNDVFEASAMLSKKNIRRLPVVQDGKLVGIITERDVTKSLYGHFNRIMSLVLDLREKELATTF